MFIMSVFNKNRVSTFPFVGPNSYKLEGKSSVLSTQSRTAHVVAEKCSFLFSLLYLYSRVLEEEFALLFAVCFVLFLYKTKQYQARGIGALHLKKPNVVR